MKIKFSVGGPWFKRGCLSQRACQFAFDTSVIDSTELICSSKKVSVTIIVLIICRALDRYKRSSTESLTQSEIIIFGICVSGKFKNREMRLVNFQGLTD